MLPGPLPCGRYLLVSLGSKAYSNSVPDQHYLYNVGQHTLAFHTKPVMIEGLNVVVFEASAPRVY